MRNEYFYAKNDELKLEAAINEIVVAMQEGGYYSSDDNKCMLTYFVGYLKRVEISQDEDFLLHITKNWNNYELDWDL